MAKWTLQNSTLWKRNIILWTKSRHLLKLTNHLNFDNIKQRYDTTHLCKVSIAVLESIRQWIFRQRVSHHTGGESGVMIITQKLTFMKSGGFHHEIRGLRSAVRLCSDGNLSWRILNFQFSSIDGILLDGLVTSVDAIPVVCSMHAKSVSYPWFLDSPGSNQFGNFGMSHFGVQFCLFCLSIFRGFVNVKKKKKKTQKGKKNTVNLFRSQNELSQRVMFQKRKKPSVRRAIAYVMSQDKYVVKMTTSIKE